MTLPCVLFIPDRFEDYRRWSDIPDRLQGRAQLIHFEQHAHIPWTTGATAEFADAARCLAPDGTFDIVVGAGQAARFAFALAEAGLAKGLVFFQPSLDRIPDDLLVDWSAVDEGIELTLPIVDAVDEPDPARRRDIFLQVLSDIAESDTDAAELELANAMITDHADEYFADLQEVKAAAADERMQPDPPWLLRPWIDRIAALSVPVTTVGHFSIGEAIARRAQDAEVIDVMGGGAIMAPAESRARATEALLRMLDRVS
ncbi:MAG: hypothetical protein ACLQFR_06545 [Streptosporangiaceae bacterium]